jgi:adenylate kinase
MFTIVMLGHQGAGKGTQSSILTARLGIPVVSLGKLLRLEAERGTGIGKEIGAYLNRGDMVPNAMVDQIIRGRLEEDDVQGGGVIIDGFPRTIEQGHAFDKILADLGRSLTHALIIKVTDDEAIRRISGRRVCSNPKHEATYHVEFNPPKKDPGKCDADGSALVQRDDDKPEAIKHRLDLYHSDTKPLIEYYRNRGLLYEINGMQPIEKVAADIAAAIGA